MSLEHHLPVYIDENLEASRIILARRLTPDFEPGERRGRPGYIPGCVKKPLVLDHAPCETSTGIVWTKDMHCAFSIPLPSRTTVLSEGRKQKDNLSRQAPCHAVKKALHQ